MTTLDEDLTVSFKPPSAGLPFKEGRRRVQYVQLPIKPIEGINAMGESTQVTESIEADEPEDLEEDVEEDIVQEGEAIRNESNIMASDMFVKQEWVRIQSMKSRYDNFDAQVKGFAGKFVFLKIYCMMEDGTISIHHSNISYDRLRLLDETEIQAAKEAIANSNEIIRNRPPEEKDEDGKKDGQYEEEVMIDDFGFPPNSWVRVISPDSKYYNCDGQVKGLTGPNKKYAQILIFIMKEDGTMSMKTSTMSCKRIRLLLDNEVEALTLALKDNESLFNKNADPTQGADPDSGGFAFNDWVRIECYKSKYNNCIAMVKGFSDITRQYHNLRVYIFHPDGSFSARTSCMSHKFFRHLDESEVKEVEERIASYNSLGRIKKRRRSSIEGDEGEGLNEATNETAVDEEGVPFNYNDWVKIKYAKSMYDDCFAQVRGFGGLNGPYHRVVVYTRGPEREISRKATTMATKHLRHLLPEEMESMRHLMGDKEIAKVLKKRQRSKKRAFEDKGQMRVIGSNQDLDHQILLTSQDSSSDEDN